MTNSFSYFPLSIHTLANTTLGIKRFISYFLKLYFVVRDVFKLSWIGKNIAGWPTLNSLIQSHLSSRNGRVGLINEAFKSISCRQS